MDSALSPREIQARIRAGVPVEDVATEAGVPVDQVEPFAVPVLAELEHVVEVARASTVRRQADPSSRRSLATLVSRVCQAHGLDEESLRWRSRRLEDRSWQVCATWSGPQGPDGDADSDDHVATFRFDMAGRHVSPEDAGARWLVDDRQPAPKPRPQSRRTSADPDLEPTIDLNDELAIVRAVTTRPAAPQPRSDRPTTTSAPAEPEVPGMTATDGVYDFVPTSQGQMDALYEMLAGFQEDSVNIYEGLEDPVATPVAQDDTATPVTHNDTATPVTQDDTATPVAQDDPGPREDTPASSGDDAEEGPVAQDGTPSDDSPTEPTQDALVDSEEEAPAKPRKRRRKQRASIPSWDEIMFGGPTPHA